MPAIASLRALAEEIRAAELAVSRADSAGCRRASGASSRRSRRRSSNKLLHLPTVRMKEAAVTPDGVVYADVVRHLFGLGEEEQA